MWRQPEKLWWCHFLLERVLHEAIVLSLSSEWKYVHGCLHSRQMLSQYIGIQLDKAWMSVENLRKISICEGRFRTAALEYWKRRFHSLLWETQEAGCFELSLKRPFTWKISGNISAQLCDYLVEERLTAYAIYIYIYSKETYFCRIILGAI